MRIKRAVKRLLINPLFIVIVVIICIQYAAIIKFIPKHGETFIGCYSEQTFSSVDEAVQAYIANEIEGISTTVDSYSYKVVNDSSKGDGLSAKAAYADTEIDDTTQIEITINCGEAAHTIYMDICYLEDNSMRYWVEPSTNGEVLTKSYYESVLSADRYTNYTINVKQTGEVDIFNIPLKVTTDASFKLTEDLGYFKQTIGTMGISGTTTAYFKNEKGGLLAYGKTSVNVVAKSINKLLNALHIDSSDDSEDVSYESEYQRCTLSTVLGECNSIADVARVGFPDGIDHTFFLKTSTGFAVNPEKRAEFSEIMVVATAQMLNYSSDSINEIIDFMDFEFDESITVYDGRISKVVMKKTGKVSEKGIESSSNEDAQVQKLLKNYKLNFTNEYLYTNFGKTTVTLPTELESYFI